ncbi:MAG: His/Gly/Thr/Pro-type tRNA ligase C-terminal domain-containing protein, partial [Candidatus Micrarchaeaceae archaeon]
KKLPMGLAIIGRAYRNEISPRQGLYRMRELIQAELQIFFDPSSWKVEPEGNKAMDVVLYKSGKQVSMTPSELIKEGYPAFYVRHMEIISNFYTDVIGIPRERFRFLEKGGKDKAFYNKVHMDIEIDIKSWGGFKEVGGLHYRGDYDLSSHSKGSGKDLSVSLDGRKLVPNVLELSFGVDRNIWLLVDVFYRKESDGRDVLGVPGFLSQYNVAVFPLQKDEALEAKAKEVYQLLAKEFRAIYDDSGSIGKRYARMDEIGTPYCVTVDFDTIDSNSPNSGKVTARRRDDRSQMRVSIEELRKIISEFCSMPNGR